MRATPLVGCTLLFLVLVGASPAHAQAALDTGQARLEAALTNILTLDRPDQDALATVWDGNKYIQCLRLPDKALRCEAAGARMQPSLHAVLTPERVKQLGALGWRQDFAFGGYAQVFPVGTPTSQVADKVLQALAAGYGADLAHLEVETNWIASEPCPPRNGPSQNLAGMINDARAMAATAVHACFYISESDNDDAQAALSTTDLIDLYGPRVTGEIQRLRINAAREVFVVLDTDVGYVQCQPETSPKAIYCEAVSAASWGTAASILTPERLARLHAAGFADPGRAPNYSKTYPAETFDDAAIARELLGVLHDAYGYAGSPELRFKTEKGE